MHQEKGSLIRHLENNDAFRLLLAVFPQAPVHTVVEIEQPFTAIDEQFTSTLEIEATKIKIVATTYQSSFGEWMTISFIDSHLV